MLTTLTRLVVLLAFALLPSALVAQELSRADAERFQQLMQSGAEAYQREDYQRSIELLEAARAIYDHPDLTYNIARAWTHLNRCSKARGLYEAYVGREDIGPEDVEKARQMLAELDSGCVSRGTLRIECTVPQTAVSIDGGQPQACPVAVEVQTGSHQIMARAPQHLPATQRAEVLEAEVTPVTITLEREAPPEPPSAAGPNWPLIGWVTAGAGGALLVTGLILDASSVGRLRALEEASENGDVAEVERLRSGASRSKAATIVLYTGGIVAIGAGTYMALFLGSDETATASVAFGGRF